jgi:hypothetical protein
MMLRKLQLRPDAACIASFCRGGGMSQNPTCRKKRHIYKTCIILHRNHQCLLDYYRYPD